MSVNKAHTSNGVLLHAGEFILLYCNKMIASFCGDHRAIYSGCKCGRIYLTSHRMIFTNNNPGDDMQSFSAPYVLLSDINLEHQVIGPNFISGRVRAQPNGNFGVDSVLFKLFFKGCGDFEFYKALSRLITLAKWHVQDRNFEDMIPPYVPPRAWYEASLAAYEPPKEHVRWLPKHDIFTEPEPNSVFITDNAPPYAGIGNAPPVGMQDDCLAEQHIQNIDLVDCACDALKYAWQK